MSITNQFLFFSILSLSIATADDTRKMNYLSKDAIPISSAIPAPPAENSVEDQTELNQILSLQNSRTAEDCARATEEADGSLGAFFGPGFGLLTADDVAKLTPFFNKVSNDLGYFVKQEKIQWNRRRPYQEDAQIKPCLPIENTNSYPSGHATASRVFSDILSFLEPSLKGSFMARANQIAMDRVMGGLHHLSDVEAGKKLGDEIFTALQKSDSFEKDLQAASGQFLLKTAQ